MANEVDEVFERWENGDRSRFLTRSEVARKNPWRDETEPEPRSQCAGGTGTEDMEMEDCVGYSGTSETPNEEYRGDQMVKENLQASEALHTGVGFKDIAEWARMLPVAESPNSKNE